MTNIHIMFKSRIALQILVSRPDPHMSAVDPHMPAVDPRYIRGGSAHARGGEPTLHLGRIEDPTRAESSEYKSSELARSQTMRALSKDRALQLLYDMHYGTGS
ncbi:hypothetical protein Y032_0068g168 [Ancylostoma ceylanicum]|uniref:Uncharacterized protein n=1 Tax=Ancylostoma ceylanicum TaxID=53326 RepID=A0A016TYE1_9BILA|nr:hypothetical protein Y032_0068g168 [Ancylostoma ceylanicum]